ncbi:MAG: hypothetical protein H6621_04005 [Halobacteriovoraceae bacterium]|nr:hypothetical protein [Halobacteriovoraceae bacterium]MCB9094213.1 hypothetical protein [Halobacteriovoraceae bacterium]
MKTLKKLLLFLIFSVFCLESYAIGPVEGNVLRKEIKNRIENILFGFDKNSRVDVKINFKNDQKTIDDNPFVLATPPVENSDYRKIVRSLELTVYSGIEEGKFPEFLIKSVKSVLNEYTRNNKVKYQVISTTAEASGGLWGLTFFQAALLSLLGVSFLLFSVFKIMGVLSSNRQRQELGKLISDNVNSLKTSFEGMSFGGGANSGMDFPTTSKPFNFEISAGGDAFLKDFSLDSLEELLMDSYWSKEDEYAAFLWSKLDIVRKGRLLAKNSRLGDYANFIADLEGVDKKYVNETYYFNPLALHEISNENLTDLVKKYNSVFHLLPKMRVANLLIDATEKKKLYMKKYNQKDTEFELQSINWSEYKSTDKRQFESNLTFYFESVEEEEAFFQEKDIDFSLVKAFPSLTWLTFLESEDARNILGQFNAKELALAWIAPQSTLEQLEELLPDKKVELLRSYTDQIKPNRKSAIFNRIVELTEQKLSLERKSAA